MYNLIIENDKGESIDLNNQLNYRISSISGLGPVDANINVDRNIGYDGSKFLSAYIDTRSITIELSIVGSNVEANRIALYKYIRPKKKVTLYYKNESRDVSIVGYVEDMEINYFSNPQKIQIVILCPQPYWKAMDEILKETGYVVPNFKFVFENEVGSTFEFGTYDETYEVLIVNDGEVECGMNITLIATNTVTNPTIYNRESSDYFGVDITMNAGDRIYINTEVGSKSVTLVDSNAQTTNIFNSIKEGSTWLNLEMGDNVFVYECDDGQEYLEIEYSHTNMYEGV